MHHGAYRTCQTCSAYRPASPEKAANRLMLDETRTVKGIHMPCPSSKTYSVELVSSQ
jgi:hypothetical protein